MKKNEIKKIFTAFTVTIVLLASLLVGADVTSAQENSYTADISKGPVTLTATSASEGELVATDGAGNSINITNFNFANDTLTITGETTTNTNFVIIDGNNKGMAPVKITLDGVKIDVRTNYKACSFEIKSGGNVNLTLSGDNELKSGSQCGGLQVETGNTVSIDKRGGNDSDNTLLAANGDSGAGIGGGSGRAGGNITISGGKITAYCANSGNAWGAGIGGGYGGDGGNITISGGIVTAYSNTGGKSFGAGIGGGYGGDGGNITISGGTVTAYSSNNEEALGAGIGGGAPRPINNGITDGGDGGDITISGGTVTAYSSYSGNGKGAGIGGGTNGTCGSGGTIKISGGTVTAYSSYSGNGEGAGIGGGGNNSKLGDAGTVTIDGGSIFANGNSNMNLNGGIQARPKNSSSADVYLSTLTIGDPPEANVDITDISISDVVNYGISGVKTDGDGKVYFWLPESESEEKVTLSTEYNSYSKSYTRAADDNNEQVLAIIRLITDITITGGDSITTKGGTLQLTAKILPTNADNKAVTWESSDTNIATVDANGLVTAVGNGTVTITATAKDGSGVSGSASINVSGQILVTDITVTGGDSITTKGGTLQLEADVLPTTADDKAVTWESSDTNIATVDANGLVTAVGNGTVTITATAKDGSGVSGSASINVSGQILVTGITVTGGDSITTKGGTLQLTANVLPANATNKAVTWTSSDTNKATVDANGLVTAVENGSVTITATAQDGSGVSGSANISISGQETIADIEDPSGGSTTDTTKDAKVTPTAASPETGDDMNIALWFALWMATGVSIAGILIYRKRKEKQQ